MNISHDPEEITKQLNVPLKVVSLKVVSLKCAKIRWSIFLTTKPLVCVLMIVFNYISIQACVCPVMD